VSADDVLAALDRLDEAGVRFWVEGGWGVDALVGRQTRPHEDLDLALGREHLEEARAALAALGYAQDPSVKPGLPARLVLRAADGRQVDLHPLVWDESGDGWQELGDGTWGRYPAAGLTGEGVIAGRRVRCTTAELQRVHHEGYEPTETDRHDLRLLETIEME
jgi:lincosamide nucleotidyltransferase A/C/D/E